MLGATFTCTFSMAWNTDAIYCTVKMEMYCTYTGFLVYKYSPCRKTALHTRSDLCILRNELCCLVSISTFMISCRSWERNTAVSFLGVFVSNFRYSVLCSVHSQIVAYEVTLVYSLYNLNIDESCC
jgi:hypothetical protein